MYNKTKLKIGEFSRLMQVTVKTLRHYERLGLLLPSEVDEATGYRYYTVSQMTRLNSIRDLKELGFSLEEIGHLHSDETHTPSVGMLATKLRECNRQIKRLLKRREQLIAWMESQKHLNAMEKFSMTSLPAITVASHRRVIKSYADLGALCVNVIGPEMQRLGCVCPPPGYCFTTEHNTEYTPTDIDIEYCEQVEEAKKDSDIIKFRHLDEVPMALCMKHYGRYERFYESFPELFEYLDEPGYEICGNIRTVYVDGIWNQDDPEKWLSVIQVPVKERQA